ncbi:CaiB/BaiF CoA-transferase family protein [Sphingopyxis sp. J-6]|uniref:CaiB/BaiF CoA transferase family protein n=1 Tax=Sphingopyxis sp. J-6 TaxID=3122054 RepID=UPI00398445B0
MTRPLENIRVLDLSRVLAGPWATQMLGDLGAEIVKVERPSSGDDTRSWGPPWYGDPKEQRSAYFMAANRNKSSVAIDMSVPEGADLIRELAKRSDVVVENFKTGGLAQYGLDYASLAAINPRLVYCSITGFGQDGPRAAQPGYDLMIQALSGLMSITGEPDREPQKVGVALVDVMTGLHAVIAILAALHQRASTGVGQYIDLALFDVAVSALANQASNYLVSGTVPGRLGNAHPNIVPYQVFDTADGQIVLAIGNDRQFADFATIIGRPEWATDDRFRTNAARVANRSVMVEEIASVLREYSTVHCVTIFGKAGLPHAPINDIASALDDPQAIHRGLRMPASIGFSVAGPLRFSGSTAEQPRTPAKLGQHSKSVLRDVLDIDRDTIESLMQRRVIAVS